MVMNRDDVVRMLEHARDRGADEVHFKVPNRPLFRTDGVLLPIEHPHLNPQATHRIILGLCALANLELPLAQITDHEFSFGLPGVGRFRVQLYRQRGSLSAVVQRMSLSAPSLADFGLEPEVEQVLHRPGLTLIAGGRRRAAVLASLVDRYNGSRRGHVVTLEDPLTFLHRDAMAAISQRDVGVDVGSFAAGLRTALRQRPELVAVGDVPDPEAAEMLLRVAEEGITVLACVAAPTAEDAPEWVIRHFGSHFREDAIRRVQRVCVATIGVPDHNDATWEPLFEVERAPIAAVVARSA